VRAFLVSLVLCFASLSVRAQTVVHFPSADPLQSTVLDGYLFDAPGAGPHPALVFLHGCSGLFNRRTGKIAVREADWAARFNALGITVLMVDSFGPRHQGRMCAHKEFDDTLYHQREFDAYAGLAYLQGLSSIRADRIGVIGWSQGGGALLNAIRASSPARPAALPHGDFRAAVAFYPASCRRSAQGSPWASPTPLLLLLGGKDVWIPLEPCEQLMSTPATGTAVDMHVYPNAYHDFDWPDMRVHEVPAFVTKNGVVPIEGTDPEARSDAQERVTSFLSARLLDSSG
jgi:dienelactone hydrolase